MNRLGALPQDDGVRFRVWAPKAQDVTLVLEDEGRALTMQPQREGYFELFVEGIGAGARYRYRLNAQPPFPDPASRYQPEGVHGPSQVVDPSAYKWQDEVWHGVAHEDLVFYELHVGAFTPEGTFRGVQDKLPYLRDLGITAIELMPVADFPGRWNWGYDHAALYAPSRAYGTPDDLRALVDAAHAHSLAVFLDVIYNHLGPDGAYLAAYAPMFTEKHHTPWGGAINLDDEGSTGVRHFFIDNALHWLREYHIDGFRLDATHALIDDSPTHFLAEFGEAVARFDEGPRRFVIAEDARNLNYFVQPRDAGGHGLDGVWADDFHHLIRHLTAGDADGYYADYAGTTMHEVAEALEKGWYFDGKPSPTTGGPRGTDASAVRPENCVFCIQNHDQIGNRPVGDRLSDDVPLSIFHAVTALLLFAPELPLLFMGQEWGASTPFQFFADHNEELGRLVSAGRKDEFKDFTGFGDEVPDPQDPGTFHRSKLNWNETNSPPFSLTLNLHRALLKLRRELGGAIEARAVGLRSLVARRGRHTLLLALDTDAVLPAPDGAEIVLHTEEPDFSEKSLPPEIAGGEVRFQRAGALIMKRYPAGNAQK